MDGRRSVPAPDRGGPAPSGVERSGAGDEPPPILGSWRALYAVVVGELLLVIVLCQWLTSWR